MLIIYTRREGNAHPSFTANPHYGSLLTKKGGIPTYANTRSANDTYFTDSGGNAHYRKSRAQRALRASPIYPNDSPRFQ
jgi:hypothetical protein